MSARMKISLFWTVAFIGSVLTLWHNMELSAAHKYGASIGALSQLSQSPIVSSAP